MEREALFFSVLGILILSFIATFGFQLTGFLVSGESIGYKNWTFSNSSEYIYDSNLISFSQTNVSLKPNTTTTQYTNISFKHPNLTRGLHDPENKLDKIQSFDNNRLDLEKEKYLDLVFSGNIANGDSISIYIKSGSASNISLCESGSYCTSSEYGSTTYSGSGEGYHNITIQNLPEPTKFLTIVSSKEINIDHVNSSQTLVGAYYNPSDKTEKIGIFDSDKFEIQKNKFFNIFFNGSLENDYTLNFYLEGNTASNVSVCRFYDCSKSYGTIQYTGSEGWFSLNLSGVEAPRKQFSLNSTKDVKINYINASFQNISYYNLTNTTYPSSGFLETKDLEIQNLKSWDKFVFGQELHEQNIFYSYSIDSGSTWTSLNSFDLSKTASKKIRFGANLTSNTTNTPLLKFIFVNYTKLAPTLSQIDKTQKASPGDLVNITLNLTNPSLVSNATAYVKYYNSTTISTINLSLDNSTGLFSGKWNSSGIGSGLYYIDVEIQSPYGENLNQRQLISLIDSTKGSFLNSSLKFVKNETLRIDAKNSSSSVLDIKTKENLENISVSIVEYTQNIKNQNTKTELGKYIDIVSDSSLNNNISSATITIYYNDTEIANSGLDESTLKIHFFNETSNTWTEIPSTVNTTGNYVTGNTTHFSTYGVFGDSTPSSSSSGGGSSGSGGVSSSSGSSSTKKPISIVIPISTFESSEESTNQKSNITENKTCKYQISVDIDKGEIKNTGTCTIDDVKIEVSESLRGFLTISNSQISNLDVNQISSFGFENIQDTLILSPISGLSVGSDEKVLYGGILKFSIIDENQVVDTVEVPVNVKKNEIQGAKKPYEFLPVLGLIAVVLAAFYLGKSIYKKLK